jgi:hypothetical protein
MTDGGPRSSSMYVAARTKSTQLRTHDRPRAAQCGENGLVTCRQAQRSGAGSNEREEYA